MSSSVDHAAGVVTMTGAGYSWAEPGRRLFLAGGWAELSAIERRHEAAFDDYLARLALSNASHANNVGVSVRADETALLELIEGGLVHESLVEEPRAA
jgi:hypothetical protein